MEITHLGPNHNCSRKRLRTDAEFGEMWRHYAFKVYRHEQDLRTGRKESYIPFPTCIDLSQNYRSILRTILKKYPKLGPLLEDKNETRLCSWKDQLLLDPTLVSTPDIIAFHPGHRILRKRGYLNRLVITKLLPDHLHHLVYQALRLPLYKFDRLHAVDIGTLQLVFSGDQVKEFWRLCRLNFFDEIRIHEFLLCQRDLILQATDDQESIPLNVFF